MNNINTYKISRGKLSKKPIGCILGSENENKFKNIVIGYIDGTAPVLIKTNLTQELWDEFCTKGLSKETLDKYI